MLKLTINGVTVSVKYLHKAKDRQTYRATINEAMRLSVRSIVVPFIGAGVYRWPLEVAEKVALEELRKCSFEQVII